MKENKKITNEALKEIVDSFEKHVKYIAIYDYNESNLDMDDIKSLFSFFNDVKDIVFDSEKSATKKEIIEALI